MNYWTQSHLLFGGYAMRANEIGESFNNDNLIQNIQQGIALGGTAFSLGKSLYNGDMSWSDLSGILGNMATNALIGDLLYLKNNYKMFSTDVKITNDQAWGLGERIAGAIYQLEAIGFSVYSLGNAVKNFFGKGAISISSIKYNPKDDVFKRGFNDKSVAFQKKYIAQNGDICRDEPFVVYLLTDGTYMMQNGHHRLKALMDLGIKNIRPDEIIKLTPEQQKLMLGER